MTPEADVPRLEVSIPLDPSRLARFRERVRDYLGTYCSSRRETDEVVLSLEEAATNAILHSGSREDLRIVFGFEGDQLQVTVSDRGAGFDVGIFDPARVPDPLGLGGRGLFLISRMTDHLELEVNDGLSLRFQKRMQMRMHPLGPRSMHEAVADLALPYTEPGRERLTAMIEELPDGFVALDWEYRVAYVNREAERLLRVARDQVLGCSVWDAFPDACGGVLATRMRDAMEQGRPHRLEQWVTSLSCWWDIWLYPMSSGLSVYVNDITVRKTAEEEHGAQKRRNELLATVLLHAQRQLDEREQELQALLAGIGDAVIAIDREWRCTFANERALAEVGRPLDDVLGVSMLELVPEVVGSAFHEAVQRAMMKGERCTVDVLSARGDRWYQATASPHEGGVSVFLRDITERKVREEEELCAGRRLRAAFERAPAGLALLDPDGRFLRVNDRYCEITGYPRAELLDRTFAQITHPDDVIADVTRAEALRTGQIAAYAMDKRYVRKDGAVIWASLTVSLVRDEEGSPEYLVAVVQDVSERKRAEEGFRLRERALQQSLERTAVLADIAHAAATAASLPEACDRTLRAAAKHLGLLAGSVHVVDRGARMLAATASFGYGPEEEPGRRPIPLDEESSIGRLVLQGLPFVSSDTERQPGIPAGVRSDSGCDWECWVAVGVPGREGTGGVLTLAFPERRSFSAGDFALFVGIAVQLGAAMEHAELNGALARQSEEAQGASSWSRPGAEHRRLDRDALEAMVDFCETGLASVGRDLTVRAANAAFARQTGLTKEALVGHPLGAVIPAIVAPCARALETGRPEVFSGKLGRSAVGGGGEPIAHEVRVTPHVRTDGVVAGLVLSVVDAAHGSSGGG